MATKKGNGEGSIYYSNADGYWKGQITTGYDDKGKQKRKTFSAKTRKGVAEKLTAFLHAQQRGMLTETSKVTVSEYIVHWLSIKEREVKKTTYQSYVQTCNLYIKPGIGHIKLQKLSTSQINSYLALQSQNGLKPASVNRQRAILHGILEQAVKENIVYRNVSNNCATVKPEKSDMNTLKPEQIKTMLCKARELFLAKGNKFNFLYHALLLALATGLRRGELLSLKWENINLADNTITVRENLVEVKGVVHFETPKTKSSIQTVSVADSVMKELQEIKTCSGLVFRTGNNTPIFPSNLTRAFRSLRSMLNMEKVRFHDLRHTHATQLLANGVNFKQVSARLGHEDIRITLDIYAHALPAQDKEAGEIMGKILLPGA